MEDSKEPREDICYEREGNQDEMKKARNIGGKAVQVFLVVLTIIVWSLFSLPTVFYLLHSDNQV